MKLDIEALSAEYDRLYDEAARILREDDPCQIRRDPDGIVRCTSVRAKMKMKSYAYMRTQQTQLCCTSCKHLGPEGCTVQSLCCKVWLCDGLRETDTAAKLRAVERKATVKGVPIGFFRTPKEVAFAEPRLHMRSLAMR